MSFLAVAAATSLVLGCQNASKDANTRTKDYSNLANQGYASVLRAGTIQNGRSSTILPACNSQIPNLISAAQFNSILEEGGRIKGSLSNPITRSFRIDIAADPERIEEKDGELTCTFAEARLEKRSLNALQSAIADNTSSFKGAKKEFLSERLPLVQEAIKVNEEIRLLREELKSIL